MADNSRLVKIGLIGAVAYYAYSQGWLSFLGIGSPAVAASATPATPALSPNAITGGNSLDAIYTRLIAAAPSGSHGVDDWNYYLNAQLGPLGKSAPDPMEIFSAAVPNFDRTQAITGPQYWAVMAPALKTQLGMSGLGIYGGLGALMRRYR